MYANCMRMFRIKTNKMQNMVNNKQLDDPPKAAHLGGQVNEEISEIENVDIDDNLAGDPASAPQGEASAGEDWETKAREYLSGWQRALADYDNFKKNSEKSREEMVKFASAGLILDLLPVLDNFKTAVKHIPEDQQNLDWVVGVRHIQKMLTDVLRNNGVEEIRTVGEKFNPELHEALEQKCDGGCKDHEILEEVQAGYLLNGKVLNPAKVVVNIK